MFAFTVQDLCLLHDYGYFIIHFLIVYIIFILKYVKRNQNVKTINVVQKETNTKKPNTVFANNKIQPNICKCRRMYDKDASNINSSSSLHGLATSTCSGLKFNLFRSQRMPLLPEVFIIQRHIWNSSFGNSVKVNLPV